MGFEPGTFQTEVQRFNLSAAAYPMFWLRKRANTNNINVKSSSERNEVKPLCQYFELDDQLCLVIAPYW